MPKELPYFKFDAAEWITGGITLESFEAQGVFINICALYWFKSGALTLTEIKRRLSIAQPVAFDSLVSAGLIDVENDVIKIKFLDEQKNNLKQLSDKNSNNGKLGGAPKGNKNATKQAKNKRKQPKTTNIEEKRREEKREEEIYHEIFSDSLFVEGLERNHKGKDFKKAFTECWQYHNQGGVAFAGWEWRRKLLTWLGNVKPEPNGLPKFI